MRDHQFEDLLKKVANKHSIISQTWSDAAKDLAATNFDASKVASYMRKVAVELMRHQNAVKWVPLILNAGFKPPLFVLSEISSLYERDKGLPYLFLITHLDVATSTGLGNNLPREVLDTYWFGVTPDETYYWCQRKVAILARKFTI